MSETVSDVLQQTLVISGDVMLIGIVDSELISRIGEFSLSLLQRGITLLCVIMLTVLRSVLVHICTEQCIYKWQI